MQHTPTFVGLRTIWASAAAHTADAGHKGHGDPFRLVRFIGLARDHSRQTLDFFLDKGDQRLRTKVSMIPKILRAGGGNPQLFLILAVTFH